MSLKAKTINGAKWSAITTFASILISFSQITFLAHILNQHQFGLLSLSLLIIMLADIVSDFGISNSIIQRKVMTNYELSTLYWLNILIGGVVFTLTFSLSGVIANFLHQKELSNLIKVLSFAFLILPIGQQYRALLQKELEFNKVGTIETISIIIGFTITILFACIYPFAITAMWGYLTMSFCKSVMFWMVGRNLYRPSFYFRCKNVLPNIKFGAYMTADALINQLNSNIATIVLSRTLGVIMAGGYNLAANVAVVPPAKLNPILTRVLFPAFSKIQDDKEKLKINFYKLLSIVGLINFPLLLGLLVVSNNFVLTLFGAKWHFITPILQILCVVGLLRSIGNPIGALLMAKARVDISLKFNIFKLFIFIPFVWIGAVTYGGIGAASGFLCVQLINTLLSYFILIKPVLGKSYYEYVMSIIMPLKLSLPTLLASFLVGFLNLSSKPEVSLFYQVFCGVITFFITLVLSKDVLIKELKVYFFKNLKT